MVSNKKLQSKPWLDPTFFINKYVLTFLVFAIWMIFFDRHNIKEQNKLKQTVAHLEEEKDTYQEMIEQVKQDQQGFESDKEKYGREKYYLHKPGEEVWIIPDEEEKSKQ